MKSTSYLRSIFGTLLMLALVCVPACALCCQAQCGAGSVAAASGADSMPGMAHCHMMRHHHGDVVSSAEPCSRVMHADVDASLLEAERSAMTLAVMPVVLQENFMAPLVMEARERAVETPPLRRTALVELQTTLRI